MNIYLRYLWYLLFILIIIGILSFILRELYFKFYLFKQINSLNINEIENITSKDFLSKIFHFIFEFSFNVFPLIYFSLFLFYGIINNNDYLKITSIIMLLFLILNFKINNNQFIWIIKGILLLPFMISFYLHFIKIKRINPNI